MPGGLYWHSYEARRPADAATSFAEPDTGPAVLAFCRSSTAVFTALSADVGGRFVSYIGRDASYGPDVVSPVCPVGLDTARIEAFAPRDRPHPVRVGLSPAR